MNRLRLALAGYDTLAQVLAIGLNEANSDEAERWLRDEVCPVCGELTRSRAFQLAARWSVDHLEPGVHTSERQMVEATDRAIVRLAEELVAASGPEGPDGHASHPRGDVSNAAVDCRPALVRPRKPGGILPRAPQTSAYRMWRDGGARFGLSLWAYGA